MGGIFLIQTDGKLVEMKEELYKSEDVFQTILADYPNLLAGDQIDSEKPRRWLLIAREISVPAQESGAGQWSLDHLFVDQDGIPTLVEVKRSTDTRIRREVVGQMLDYAANAVAYWPLESIRDHFGRTCETHHVDGDQVLREFLAETHDIEGFWKSVKTNLQAGRVRMLFVADQIPPELKRIVEFLNEQMDPAEVLAVELRQYVSQGLRTLVPRVFGQTADAERRKTVSARGEAWTEARFFQALQAKGNVEMAIGRKIYELVTDQKCKRAWSVQVKTNAGRPGFWLLNKHSRETKSETHIYALVNLGQKNARQLKAGPDFYVVPSRVLARRIEENAAQRAHGCYFLFHIQGQGGQLQG